MANELLGNETNNSKLVIKKDITFRGVLKSKTGLIFQAIRSKYEIRA